MCLLASGPQRRPLLLQVYSVQQQGELPGGDAPDGNFHPREVSCSHSGGKTSEPETVHLKVFFSEMHHGSWRQMRILSFWRFTPTATLTFASAETAALIPLKLGTEEAASVQRKHSSDLWFSLFKLV